MVTTVHTGGSSIPGSSGIWSEHILALDPDVSFHVNGGPIAMPDEGFPRLVNESKVALQVCTAGNLRTTLWLSKLVREADQFDRFLIATDTPTGSGIMPLGMMYTITHLASLADVPVEWAIAAATGNNAKVYGLNSVSSRRARTPMLLLSTHVPAARKTMRSRHSLNGDIAAVSAVITDGVPRFVGRSRNTPEGIRRVRVARSNVIQDFSAAPH